MKIFGVITVLLMLLALFLITCLYYVSTALLWTHNLVHIIIVKLAKFSTGKRDESCS
jgi:hypothetical protein